MGTSHDELKDIIWYYEELIYKLSDAPQTLDEKDQEQIRCIREKMR